MTDKIQKSIVGRRFGLDESGNAVIGDGNSIFVADNASTKPARVATSYINTAPTTAANLANYGVHVLTSAQGTYLLDDPVPGQRVTIMTESQTTANARIVKVSTGSVTFGSSGGYNSWNSSAAHVLQLIGITTAKYGVIDNSLASTVSTSYGVFSTI